MSDRDLWGDGPQLLVSLFPVRGDAAAIAALAGGWIERDADAVIGPFAPYRPDLFAVRTYVFDTHGAKAGAFCFPVSQYEAAGFRYPYAGGFEGPHADDFGAAVLRWLRGLAREGECRAAAIHMQDKWFPDALFEGVGVVVYEGVPAQFGLPSVHAGADRSSDGLRLIPWAALDKLGEG